MYAAIQKMEKDKQANVIQAIADAGAGTGWYDTYTKGKPKIDLDTLISGKSDLKDKNSLEKFINDTPANKDKMNAYFAIKDNTSYTTPTIGNKTYTITKVDDKYVATENTTPTPEKIAEAKKAMDAVIASKKPINNATLQNTFNDAVNKKIIEDYFSTGDPKAYKTKLSGTEYTVTQKPTTPP